LSRPFYYFLQVRVFIPLNNHVRMYLLLNYSSCPCLLPILSFSSVGRTG
jgi:hypothetical protein